MSARTTLLEMTPQQTWSSSIMKLIKIIHLGDPAYNTFKIIYVQSGRLNSLDFSYVQVLWNGLINSLWNNLLSHVEEAWLAMDSGFMHPDKGRLPLATPLDVRAELPPAECVDRNLPRRSRSRLRLTLLMLFAEGRRASVAVVVVTDSHRPSHPASSTLPALTADIRVLRRVA